MSDLPLSASLANPLYYLENARTLINWVLKLHADLLTDAERASLDTLLSAPTDVQALLIRMVMRTQTLYRASQLEHYAEIAGDPVELLSSLASAGLVELEPSVATEQLSDLLNKDELLAVHNRLAALALPKSASKGRITESLSNHTLDARPLGHWLDLDVPSARLTCQPLFDRLRLMFFGNLRQSWSEFVVTELGYFNYEPVELNTASRAFHHRTEVDQYLALNAIYEQSETLPFEQRIELAKAVDPINDWIGGRWSRLAYSLAQEAERTGDTALALELYRQSGLGDALIRELRVMERTASPEATQERLEHAAPRSLSPLHQLSIARVVARISKKLGAPKPAPELRTPEAFNISLPKPEQSVELATAAALSYPEKPIAYVENCLINSLFGLLFWDALYAPVQGAFFHPFQSHPADLYRSSFISKRRAIIDDCFEKLSNGRYIQSILERYDQKQGITNAFIHWSLVTPELLALALKLIPAQHLMLIFQRLLSDIRTHRSGFPDLIQFDLIAQSYRLIEVKGPGDRLQDNQKLWLDYFVEHQIPCSVCWVSWSDQLA